MPTQEPESWSRLWGRLVALGWRQEIKVRAGTGRKDHYYFPPHRRQGDPRQLDSRTKVRRFVKDAARLDQVATYAAEVTRLEDLLQQAQAKNRSLQSQLRAATHPPRSGPGSEALPIQAFAVTDDTWAVAADERSARRLRGRDDWQQEPAARRRRVHYMRQPRQ